MRVVIDIPDASIEDYHDLYSKIYGMAASEGLFDDKHKSQKALALKVVLEILVGIKNGTPLPKGHGDLIDRKDLIADAYPIDDWSGNEIIIVEAKDIDNALTIIEADK